jgi:hypothetical protein
MQQAYDTWVENPKTVTTRGYTHRLEYNIKIKLKEIRAWERGVD